MGTCGPISRQDNDWRGSQLLIYSLRSRCGICAYFTFIIYPDIYIYIYLRMLMQHMWILAASSLIEQPARCITKKHHCLHWNIGHRDWRRHWDSCWTSCVCRGGQTTKLKLMTSKPITSKWVCFVWSGSLHFGDIQNHIHGHPFVILFTNGDLLVFTASMEGDSAGTIPGYTTESHYRGTCLFTISISIISNNRFNSEKCQFVNSSFSVSRVQTPKFPQGKHTLYKLLI